MKGILCVVLYLAFDVVTIKVTISTTTQTIPHKRYILCLLECNISNSISLFIFNFIIYFHKIKDP